MDISVFIGEHKFNYRVAAIIRKDEKVLFHHGIGKEVATLIGGRVEAGENSIEALQREVYEEIGMRTKYVKPVALIENFFTRDGNPYHEILMIHELKFENKEDYQKDILPIEERKKDVLEFLWCDVKNYTKYRIVPDNLPDIIAENGEFKHIINYDWQKD